jgi:hypothetical protein
MTARIAPILLLAVVGRGLWRVGAERRQAQRFNGSMTQWFNDSI